MNLNKLKEWMKTNKEEARIMISALIASLIVGVAYNADTIAAVLTKADAIQIQSKPVVKPTAADDGKSLVYITASAAWKLRNVSAGEAGVTSVNGQTGAVVLDNTDVGAASLVGGKIPIGELPTGTTSSHVSYGNHGHTGTYEPANSNLQTHVGTTGTPHVTNTEKNTWNSKQDALGYTPVPNTRTINGNPLSSNVTLTSSDVGAEPADPAIQAHISSASIHVTPTDKTRWDGNIPTLQNLSSLFRTNPELAVTQAKQGLMTAADKIILDSVQSSLGSAKAFVLAEGATKDGSWNALSRNTRGLFHNFSGNSRNGWSASGATITRGAAGIHLVSSTTDPIFLRDLISVDGSKYDRIKIRIKRIAGSGWDGTVHWGRSDYPTIDGSNRKSMGVSNPSIGSTIEISLDMNTVDAGVWVGKTITSLRFDFGNSSADYFLIDSVKVESDGSELTENVDYFTKTPEGLAAAQTKFPYLTNTGQKVTDGGTHLLTSTNNYASLDQYSWDWCALQNAAYKTKAEKNGVMLVDLGVHVVERPIKATEISILGAGLGRQRRGYYLDVITGAAIVPAPNHSFGASDAIIISDSLSTQSNIKVTGLRVTDPEMYCTFSGVETSICDQNGSVLVTRINAGIKVKNTIGGEGRKNDSFTANLIEGFTYGIWTAEVSHYKAEYNNLVLNKYPIYFGTETAGHWFTHIDITHNVFDNYFKVTAASSKHAVTFMDNVNMMTVNVANNIINYVDLLYLHAEAGSGKYNYFLSVNGNFGISNANGTTNSTIDIQHLEDYYLYVVNNSFWDADQSAVGQIRLVDVGSAFVANNYVHMHSWNNGAVAFYFGLSSTATQDTVIDFKNNGAKSENIPTDKSLIKIDSGSTGRKLYLTASGNTINGSRLPIVYDNTYIVGYFYELLGSDFNLSPNVVEVNTASDYNIPIANYHTKLVGSGTIAILPDCYAAKKRVKITNATDHSITVRYDSGSTYALYINGTTYQTYSIPVGSSVEFESQGGISNYYKWNLIGSDSKWAHNTVGINYNAGRVGIGTSNPVSALDIYSNTGFNSIYARDERTASGGGGFFLAKHNNAAAGNYYTLPIAGDRLGGLMFGTLAGLLTGPTDINSAGIFGYASENMTQNASCSAASTPWACCTGAGTGTCGAYGSEIRFEVAPKGSSARRLAFKITSSGDIHTGPATSSSYTDPSWKNRTMLTTYGGTARAFRCISTTMAVGTLVEPHGNSWGVKPTVANSGSAIGAVFGNVSGSGQACTSGRYCWIVDSGTAQVLMKNSTACAERTIAITSDTAGRATCSTAPEAATTHWQEIGHPLEAGSAGTDVLVPMTLHFNFVIPSGFSIYAALRRRRENEEYWKNILIEKE